MVRHLRAPLVKWIFSRMRKLLPLVLLLVFGSALLGYEAWHLGMTADEPSHLAASYAWWLGADVLQPSDTPPLTRIISGWVPRAMGIPLRRDTVEWRSRNAYDIGARLIAALEPTRAQRLLFAMRLPFIIFPLLITFLLWRWGSELFGERIGLILAACGILEPTILGHGALIKSDVPAAFGAVWFAYAAWRYWLGPDLRRLVLMVVALVVATLTKFTLLPLIGVALVLALWRGPRLAGILITVPAFYVATLAAYQFRASPIGEPELASFVPAGVPEVLMPLATTFAKLPWPTQYVRGLLYIRGSLHGPGFNGYMLGHRITGMVPAYYPLAWAIKFPVPLQILTIAALVALLLRIRQNETGAADVLIWGSAMLYFGSAVFSSFHIGFRHVLPALPFFILGGGFALARWATNRSRLILVVAVCIVWLAASSLHAYPHGISYFNEWIGGPKNGWKYLADSNVDWGQNLPELASFMQNHHIPRVKVFLFGLDAPDRYLVPGSWEAQPWPYAVGVVQERRLRPTSGIYAISVNALMGFLAPVEYQDYLADFRDREPIGRAGYGIFIYEVK
jgi:hypothetical protein